MKADKTIEFLKVILESSLKKLPFSQNTNTYLPIGPTGTEFEILTNLELNLQGTGTTSGGSDHSDESEGKGSNHIQPKDCASGGKYKNNYICEHTKKTVKVHPFTTNCPNCGKDIFFYHTDARWSIQTNSHFKYSVPRYNGWVFMPEEQSSSNRKFLLELYLIDSKNKHFNEILEVQNRYGKSGNKNFLPFSADFYASNPKLKTKIHIDISEEVKVQRLPVEELQYNRQVIDILEKTYLDDSFKMEKKYYTYNEIEPYLDIKRKKTSHGKERGVTSRRNK